jgi:hypothetical protein
LKASNLWTESPQLVNELISWLQSKQDQLDVIVEGMPNSGLVIDFEPYVNDFCKVTTHEKRSISFKSYALSEIFETSMCTQQQAVLVQYAKLALEAAEPKPTSIGACASLLEAGLSAKIGMSEECVMAIQSAFVAHMVRPCASHIYSPVSMAYCWYSEVRCITVVSLRLHHCVTELQDLHKTVDRDVPTTCLLDSSADKEPPMEAEVLDRCSFFFSAPACIAWHFKCHACI